MNPEPAPEKPRTQVVEETHETLTVLDQDRLTRERKASQEAGPAAEGHEARFAERHFAPRHAMGIEEIRDRVDALQVKRRLAPEAPLPPLPEPPAPAPFVRDEHRAALAPLVEGKLVSVEVVYRAGRGDVVEAVSESDGVTRRALYIVAEGVARPADDLESRIDEMPAPQAPAPEPSRPPEPARETPKKEPKLKLPFGRKADKPAEAPKPAEAAQPADEKPSRKRFGFGKR